MIELIVDSRYIFKFFGSKVLQVKFKRLNDFSQNIDYTFILLMDFGILCNLSKFIFLCLLQLLCHNVGYDQVELMPFDIFSQLLKQILHLLL